MSNLFPRCPACQSVHFVAFLKKDLYRCSRCGHLLRVKARQRLRQLLDPGSFQPLAPPSVPQDPIAFPDYRQKLVAARKSSGQAEAILTGIGRIGGMDLALGVMEPAFIMASMGAFVGEAICRLADAAIHRRLPLLLVVCSGGARMQEGIVSLMQMAKTSMAIRRLHDRGLPYFALLTDPTTGGVTASFATLADVIMAEKRSLIGFAGPRVIRQTIGQDLPEGFQTAEFLLEHGMLDMVLERAEVRPTLERLLRLHQSRPYDTGRHP